MKILTFQKLVKKVPKPKNFKNSWKTCLFISCEEPAYQISWKSEKKFFSFQFFLKNFPGQFFRYGMHEPEISDFSHGFQNTLYHPTKFQFSTIPGSGLEFMSVSEWVSEWVSVFHCFREFWSIRISGTKGRGKLRFGRLIVCYKLTRIEKEKID